MQGHTMARSILLQKAYGPQLYITDDKTILLPLYINP